jgi:uncharacterized membrane protein (DUF373 family)
LYARPRGADPVGFAIRESGRSVCRCDRDAAEGFKRRCGHGTLAMRNPRFGDGAVPMLDIKALKHEWHELTSYQRFEQVVSRIVMAFMAIVIVYTVILVAIELADDFRLGRAFMEQELLQDVFGSILTILILIEFNHSIAVALKEKTGVVQARLVVLIGILVMVRKIILLDFSKASNESLLAHAGVALALGLLYWLMVAANRSASTHGESRAEPGSR